MHHTAPHHATPRFTVPRFTVPRFAVPRFTPRPRAGKLARPSSALLAWVALLVALGLLLAATPATGVPTFARKYQTSCATCHQAFPRLNAVGEAYRLAGFRFPDDELYRKVEPVELGDEAYKRLWPRALWPSDIPRTSPLSFVSRWMVEADLDNTRPSTLTYLLPEEIELVWVGNIGDNIAYYGDAIFLQKDFGGMDPDSWATLKAWIQFQNLFRAGNKLNLRIGTVGTQTIGLFTARDANFYGTHFYLYTSWGMPLVDLEAAGLSEFRGNNFYFVPQMGVEVNGFGEHWFYAFGNVNGNLETHPTLAPSSDITFVGLGTGSSGNDFYLHLAYKVGGLPFDRGGEEPAPQLLTASEFWRDDSLIFSLFGYRGSADIASTDLTGTAWEGEDDFWRLGLGVQKQWRDLSFSAAYIKGKNDNPYGNLSPEAVDSTGWHVEVLGFAYPWLIPYARYEVLELDMPVGVPGIAAEQDIERIVAGAKMLIRPNVACIVEGAYYTRGAQLEEGFDETLFILLAVSF